jgi:hypothetical protein
MIQASALSRTGKDLARGTSCRSTLPHHEAVIQIINEEDVMTRASKMVVKASGAEAV